MLRKYVVSYIKTCNPKDIYLLQNIGNQLDDLVSVFLFYGLFIEEFE